MRNVETINKEIEALKAEREALKGTTTEVYTRIVGYYRSVRNWNKGKREEFNKRITFKASGTPEAAQSWIESDTAGRQKDLFTAEKTPAGYLYFFRRTCPNCPPVKNFLESLDLSGRNIDVDSDAGFEEARALEILASPTVILLDAEGHEIFRSSRVEELKEIILESSEVKTEVALEV